MKRLLVLMSTLVAMCLSVCTTLADPISTENAIQVGNTYLDARSYPGEGITAIAENSPTLYGEYSIGGIRVLTLEDSNDALAYVLELDPKGFIVVSPDTDIRPIIAYSFENTFPFEDVNSPLLHMVTWDMGNRLGAIPVTSKEVKVNNNALWERYLSSDETLVAQLATAQQWGPWIATKWDQGNPYNKYCPCVTSLGGWCITRAAVGCAATAMAQIINYWGYPDSVEFIDTDRYITKTLQIQIDQDADDHEFPDFGSLNQMLSAIDYSNEDDIAALCFACGISMEMDYDVDWWFFPSSGAVPVADAFKNKFKYSFAEDKKSSDNDFYDMLLDNMKNNKPALLAIFKKQGEDGHAIVADGFKDTGEYHLNFGWAGSSDGWYFLPQGMPSGYNIVDYGVLDIWPGPIPKGIAWLRGRQAGDGSWYNDPAVTSFTVLTMLNWGYDESDPIVSKGINYIRSNINADGSVYSNIRRSTYYTSIAILPLAATHNSAYHNDVEKMRMWLIDLQWDESCVYGSVNTTHSFYGGWGYGSSGWADLSNTQWALMGLKAADNRLGLSAGSTYNKCADWFLPRCRNGDGGSYYYPYGGGSIHTMTAASVWSYALCGRGSGAEALGGIQWLTDNYSLTNNDGWGYWSEYYYKVTLAKALTMTHKDMLGSHNWFNELSDKLIEEQYAAGNWPDTGMYGSELSTCWAIMALQTRTLPPSGEFGMWATLESHADLHIYDPQGRHLGVNYETNTIEENIAGATFKILDLNGNEVPYNGNTPDEGFRQVVDLPMVIAGSYRFELVGTSDGPYHLIIGGTQDGSTVTSQTYDGEILAGQRLATNVTVTSMEGALTFIYEPLSVLPTLGVEPGELRVVVEPGTIGEATFTVKEVGGQETLHGVSMYCTDITGPDGYIDGSTVDFDVVGFDVPAGGQQIVNASIPVPADFKGPATGSIIVESIDGGTKAITLRLLTDVTGPEVNVVFPEPDIAVQDGITLAATASDISGVDEVYFCIREPNDGNGVPIGKEDVPATFNPVTGKWECAFDTTQLQDGYYVVLAKAVDTYGNVGWSQIVPFSIRNWAVIKLLPATPSNKAGRTMPVKFSIRIAQAVDPAMPFVYNEDLEIRIYKSTSPSVILQRSLFGPGATDYRIDTTGEKYITNFKTSTTPATYVVEIRRPQKNFKVASFTFKTVK